MMEMVFSVGSALRLYNDDPRSIEAIEGVSGDGSRRRLRRDGNELVELQGCGLAKKTCCVLQLQ
jgi:hypothetical protein